MTSGSEKHQLPHNDPRAFAYRLIEDQLHVIRDNEKAVTENDVRALHDLRVAIRRIRVLLSAFGSCLHLKNAQKLEQRFSRIQKKLGPARDADVLLRIMEKEIRPKNKHVEKERKMAITHLRKHRERRQQEVVTLLTGASYKNLKSDIRTFMKKELRMGKKNSDISLERIAKKTMDLALRRMKKRSRLHAGFPADEIHRLRIATRKARYLAEFFSPIRAKDMNSLACQLHEIQNILGDIHDLDVLITGVQSEFAAPPKALLKLLENKRATTTNVFSKNFPGQIDNCFHFPLV